MTKPLLSIFTGTENLGLIYREQNQINVKAVDFWLATTGTEGRVYWDVLGKKRIVTIQAAQDGQGFTGGQGDVGILAFLTLVEEWINPDLSITGMGRKVFTDSLGRTFNMKVLDFTWNRLNTDPFRIVYSLMLIESV